MVQVHHVPMNKKQAEYIYWVLTDKHNFTTLFLESDPEYDLLKRERVKIANRYMELRNTHSFDDSERIAKIEWLMNYEV